MAVTNADKIAKLEAKVASLRLQYNFLNDHLKMISGKNPNLETKVKSVMEWNQSLQLKVLGEVDSKFFLVCDFFFFKHLIVTDLYCVSSLKDPRTGSPR